MNVGHRQPLALERIRQQVRPRSPHVEADPLRLQACDIGNVFPRHHRVRAGGLVQRHQHANPLPAFTHAQDAVESHHADICGTVSE